MRAATAIVFLLSFAVHAQTVGPENRYERLTGEYDVVATNSGAVIAWRGADALRAGSVDGNGRFESASPIDANADAPALARAGDAILLAFNYQQPDVGGRVAAIALDAQGRAAGPLRLFEFTRHNPPTPLVASHGTTFSLWDPLYRYKLDTTGAVIRRDKTDDVSLIHTFEGGELRYRRRSQQERWSCGFSMCGWTPPFYSVSWELIGARYGSFDGIHRSWYAPGLPAAAGEESEIVVIWNSPDVVEGVILRNGKTGPQILIPGSVDYQTSPAIAFDGARYLIVFEDYGDVYGAWFDASTNIGHRFPIATSGLAEADVDVVALSRGRFLVTYRIDDTLAGRIVTTADAPPQKRRSAR